MNLNSGNQYLSSVIQWIMDKEDARRLSPAEQPERRRQVIRTFRRGMNKLHIADAVGLSYSATRKIVDRYEDEGLAALTPGQRGRRESELRALSANQEAPIRQMICDACPEQLGMEFALWSLRPAYALSGQAARALGFHAAETDPARLRVIVSGGEDVVGQ